MTCRSVFTSSILNFRVSRAPRRAYAQIAPFSDNSVPTASFEELKLATETEGTLIIDVREPEELKETGTIPRSINIPLGEVENVLQNTTSEEFQERYHKEKPDIETPIIFSCKLGRRGASAQEIASKLGYKNARNFGGGWEEWARQNE